MPSHFPTSTFHVHNLMNIYFLLLLFIIINTANDAIALPSPSEPTKLSKQNDNSRKLDNELDILAKQIEKINSTIHELEQNSNQIGTKLDGKNEAKWDKAVIERLAKEREELVKTKKDMVEGALEIDLITGNTNEMPIPSSSAIGNKSEQQLTDVKKAEITSQSDASRLLCQFFVFGILFGVVCSISACSCFFRSRRNSISPGSGSRSNTNPEEANLNRLSQIQEPFSPNKPYYLKFDERGHCYASPLTREVPPLPNYEDACKMRTPAELLNKKMSSNRQKRSSSSTTTAEAILADRSFKLNSWI